MAEEFESICQEYIDFINSQTGVYMDALAGFAGHKTKVERQVHRAQRQSGTKIDKDGNEIMLLASYEDPTKPDVIHNRIIRAKEYIHLNSPHGSNERQHSQAILIFLYTYWEHEIRPRLAISINIESKDIHSDVLGDLRILRNVILHQKGIIDRHEFSKLKKITNMFAIDEPVHPSYDDMHKIFVFIKQDCAKMIFKYLGTEPPGFTHEDIVDIAVQKNNK